MTEKTTLYSGIWDGGEQVQLDEGLTYLAVEHPGFSYGCLRVPDGYKAQIRQGRDGSGDGSPVFEAGYYPDLGWLGWSGENECVIRVEKVPYHAGDLCFLYQGVAWMQGMRYADLPYDGFGAWLKHPPGRYNVPDDFDVWTVHIPANKTMKLYDGPDQTGQSIELSDGTYELVAYGFGGRVRSIDYAADEFVFTGLVADMENASRIPTGQRVSTVTMVNDSDAEATVRQMIKDVVGTDTTEEWNVEAGVTMKTEIEASGGGIFGGVSVTAGIEVSVSAGYGQSLTSSQSVEVEREASVTLPSKGIVHADLVVEMSRATIPVKRTWRNKRTGHEIVERGVITTEYASEASVRVY